MRNGTVLLRIILVLLAGVVMLAAFSAPEEGTALAVRESGLYLENVRPSLEQLVFAKRVTVYADDLAHRLWSGLATVDEVIASLGIRLGPWDRVEPPAATVLQDEMEIVIVRVEQETVVEEVTVPFRTIRTKSNQLALGQTRELRQGLNGLVENTYRVIVENGEEVDRVLLSSVTLVQKQDRLLEEGTIGTISRGGQNLRYTQALNVVATAYDPGFESTGKHPGHPLYGITRSGQPAVQGVTIAVDPTVIPLGTRVYVEGLDAYGRQFSGVYIAMDTGGAIKGNRIDIYFDCREAALRFGRRNMRVYVLTP